MIQKPRGDHLGQLLEPSRQAFEFSVTSVRLCALCVEPLCPAPSDTAFECSRAYLREQPKTRGGVVQCQWLEVRRLRGKCRDLLLLRAHEGKAQEKELSVSAKQNGWTRSLTTQDL